MLKSPTTSTSTTIYNPILNVNTNPFAEIDDILSDDDTDNPNSKAAVVPTNSNNHSYSLPLYDEYEYESSSKLRRLRSNSNDSTKAQIGHGGGRYSTEDDYDINDIETAFKDIRIDPIRELQLKKDWETNNWESIIHPNSNMNITNNINTSNINMNSYKNKSLLNDLANYENTNLSDDLDSPPPLINQNEINGFPNAYLDNNNNSCEIPEYYNNSLQNNNKLPNQNNEQKEIEEINLKRLNQNWNQNLSLNIDAINYDHNSNNSDSTQLHSTTPHYVTPTSTTTSNYNSNFNFNEINIHNNNVSTCMNCKSPTSASATLNASNNNSNINTLTTNKTVLFDQNDNITRNDLMEQDLQNKATQILEIMEFSIDIDDVIFALKRCNRSKLK